MIVIMKKNEIMNAVSTALNAASEMIGDEIEIVNGWTIINDYNGIIHLNTDYYEWCWDMKDSWQTITEKITDYIYQDA